ncbi:MAG: SDR family NAD(P)-dependent oxidoreductase, partial [Proteobacteria bacterium]
MQVDGKKIWITGASSGIGEALAVQLAAHGAKLILSSRNEAELQRVKSLCTGGGHQVIPLDLMDYRRLEVTAAGIWDQFGPIDILINNAGISQRYLALESSLELDEKIMAVNFFGTIAITRPILKKMAARGSGHIVTIS